MPVSLQESMRKALNIIDNNSVLNENDVFGINENEILDENIAQLVGKLKSYISKVKPLPAIMKQLAPMVKPYIGNAKEIIKSSGSGKITPEEAKTKLIDLAKGIAVKIPSNAQVNEALDPSLYYALSLYDEPSFIEELLDIFFFMPPEFQLPLVAAVVLAIVGFKKAAGEGDKKPPPANNNQPEQGKILGADGKPLTKQTTPTEPSQKFKPATDWISTTKTGRFGIRK